MKKASPVKSDPQGHVAVCGDIVLVLPTVVHECWGCREARGAV